MAAELGGQRELHFCSLRTNAVGDHQGPIGVVNGRAGVPLGMHPVKAEPDAVARQNCQSVLRGVAVVVRSTSGNTNFGDLGKRPKIIDSASATLSDSNITPEPIVIS